MVGINESDYLRPSFFVFSFSAAGPTRISTIFPSLSEGYLQPHFIPCNIFNMLDLLSNAPSAETIKILKTAVPIGVGLASAAYFLVKTILDDGYSLDKVSLSAASPS